MSLGINIYRLRTSKNLSQGDLAEALHVSRQSISKWETDGAVPALDKLLALSDLFGISLDTLVRGEIPETTRATDFAPSTVAAPQEAPAPTPIWKIVVIVLLTLLGLSLFFSLLTSPAMLPGFAILFCLVSLLYAAYTRFREGDASQNPLKSKMLLTIIICAILIVPVFSLANRLPKAPTYAKIGKESMLVAQDYPGLRFTVSADQQYASVTLLNETGQIVSYDSGAERLEVKKSGKWYEVHPKSDAGSKLTLQGNLEDGRYVSIMLYFEDRYGLLAPGEYRVMLQVYPRSDFRQAQWLAQTFTIYN